MTDELLAISAFARRVGLTPSALRFYDDCGLLRPAKVDDQNGYRYYAPDQEPRAALLRDLREIDLPLAEVRVVLDEGPAAGAAVVRAHLRTVEGKADAARRASCSQSKFGRTSAPRFTAIPNFAVGIENPCGVAVERLHDPDPGGHRSALSHFLAQRMSKPRWLGEARATPDPKLFDQRHQHGLAGLLGFGERLKGGSAYSDGRPVDIDGAPGSYKARLPVEPRTIPALVTDYERKSALARAPYL